MRIAAIAAATASDEIGLWNLQGEKILTLEAHDGNVRTLDISPDGGALASGGEDRELIIWYLSLFCQTPKTF